MLPIPLLVSLQINIRRKTALIAVFLLGLFTTICSVMRMVQIITIAKTGNSTMLVLWGTIEMNVGVSTSLLILIIKNFSAQRHAKSTSRQISLTCIPTLAPLFTYFREKTSYYVNGASRDRTTEGSGLKLQSRSRSRRDRSSMDRWRDTDANGSDASSQKEILGLESSLGGQKDGESDNKSGVSGKGGIMATVTVDVKVEEAQGGKFKRQERWGERS